MPLACVAGLQTTRRFQFYDRELLLRHFSECLLTEIATHTPSTSGFEQKILETLLHDCVSADLSLGKNAGLSCISSGGPGVIASAIPKLHLFLPLLSASRTQPATRPLGAPVSRCTQTRSIPTSTLNRLLVVKAQASERTTKQLGESFEQNLLLNLGYAARIYPKLWQGLETDQPVSILMDLPGACEFCKTRLF